MRRIIGATKTFIILCPYCNTEHKVFTYALRRSHDKWKYWASRPQSVIYRNNRLSPWLLGRAYKICNTILHEVNTPKMVLRCRQSLIKFSNNTLRVDCGI